MVKCLPWTGVVEQRHHDILKNAPSLPGAVPTTYNANRSDLQHERALVVRVLEYQVFFEVARTRVPRVAPRVCDYSATTYCVVKRVVDMPVQPKVWTLLEQVGEVANKSRVCRVSNVAWVYRKRVWPVVRNDDGFSFIRPREFSREPCSRSLVLTQGIDCREIAAALRPDLPVVCDTHFCVFHQLPLSPV